MICHAFVKTFHLLLSIVLRYYVLVNIEITGIVFKLNI